MQKKKQKKIIKSNQKPFDFALCITIFLLLSLGIIMVLSASAPSSLSTNGNSYTYVLKQLGFAIVGIVLMFFISRIDYRIYKNFYKIAYVIAIIALFSVAIPGIGVEVKGARRWINLGFGNFQPSEIAKVALIVFYAGYLTDHKDVLYDFKKGFIKPLLFLVPPIGILFFVQNHLSVSLVICIVVITIMFMAGCRLKHFAVVGVVAISILIGVFGLLQVSGSNSFRLDRISTYFDPWADAQGTGYQTVQSLYAIGSGGMFGLGLGNSKQKYLYIPEPHNDFIFSILAEELGFVGCIIVVALFMIFIWRGILIAMRTTDMFGSLIAVGITTQIAVQAIINISVVTATVPTTGMSLPFFSYGGTALLLLLANVGILLNISRSNSKV